MTTTRHPSQRRRIRNYFAGSGCQLRLAILIIFFLVALVLVFESMTYYRLSNLVHTLSTHPYGLPESSRLLLVRTCQDFFFKHIIQSVLFAIAIAGTAIVFTHRTYGPLVSIKRFIQLLIDGQYQQQLTLRRDDDLKDIATKLNELAQALKKKRA